MEFGVFKWEFYLSSMQEDFLHYLWKYKKMQINQLKTVQEESIVIKSVGEHNHNAGPDFFNAQLQIGNQLWAGNLEIHIKSSDWFVHNHEQDKAYDNVILHVVWEHDTEVFRSDNSQIPTLELKKYISEIALANYHKLFSNTKQWINCENEFSNVEDFLIQNWLERLYFERLEQKAKDIDKLLSISNNNWEAVLFKMMSKNFGLKVNGEPFLSIANSFNFSIIRKLYNNQVGMEALLFGQAGLLDKEIQDSYFSELKEEYKFLQTKFQLVNRGVLSVQFFRLRPSNFPTVRLSQLATLYSKEQGLFSKIIETNSLNEFYKLFSVSTSIYWQSHYTFTTTSRKSKKTFSKAFIDLLIINTIVPIKFAYAKFQGKQLDEEIINLVNDIASEKNNVINKFNNLKKVSISALQSQALLQLKNKYCQKNKCLDCAIGNSLISSNN